MNIADISPATEEKYFGCLYTSPEDWKDWAVGISRKRDWYHSMQDKGLRVKLSLDDDGEPRGMIQYAPAELNFPSVKNMYFIHCMYIPAVKKRKSFRKTGMGEALLKAVEDDARERGADAMLAWGLSMPFWMKASYFKKNGYSKADKNGIALLMWKPFTKNAEKPAWDRPKKLPEKVRGKVSITSFNCGMCTLQSAHSELTREVAAEFGDAVQFQEIDTGCRENQNEWGISNAIYLDGREMISGPPMNRIQIRRKISSRVKKLK